MSRHTHEHQARLSGYLDGDLSRRETEALDEHLERCGDCRLVLAGLEEVRARARALEDRPPARDLWPGIRDALDRARVIDLADHLDVGAAAARPRRRRRGVFLSLPQLGAAAAVVVVLARGGAWGLARVAGPSPGPGTDGSNAAVPAARAAGSVDAMDGRFASHAAEVAELQEVLRNGRSRLDPNTVRILEKNLALIDAAIRESLEALAVDPGNTFVEEHLRRSFERKVTYLRDAAALLESTD